MKINVSTIGREILKLLLVSLIIYSSFQLYEANSLFWIGVHNIDLSYNMCGLETQGITPVDLNSAGFKWDRNEMYSQGLYQIKTGLNRVYLNLTWLFVGVLALVYGGKKNGKDN